MHTTSIIIIIMALWHYYSLSFNKNNTEPISREYDKYTQISINSDVA